VLTFAVTVEADWLLVRFAGVVTGAGVRSVSLFVSLSSVSRTGAALRLGSA
jgi:hypothetical protein